MSEEVESLPSLRSSGEYSRERGEGKQKKGCILKRKERLETIFERLGMDGPWRVSVRERLERELSTFSEHPESSRVDLSWAFISETTLFLHLVVREGFYRWEGPFSFHFHYSPNSYQAPTIHSLCPSLYHPFINCKGEVSLQGSSVGSRGLVLSLVDLFLDPQYLTTYFDL